MTEAIKEVDVASLDQDPPPQVAPRYTEVEAWSPDLNPQQQKLFDDTSNFILAYGEKGSGKSVGTIHKLVRHCYENNDALVIVISPSIRTGSEGIWHDLLNLVLPQWKDGMGLEHSDSKLDPNTKDRHIWIGNMHGGWSKVLLISIPNASQIQERIKGPAPSMVVVDELTECSSPDYLKFIGAQLGRRRGITGPQQYIASCNPKGKKHWVYKAFFVDCVDPKTGDYKPGWKVYHIPVTENAHRLPAGYMERLEELFASDPIERRRLIDGEWIDRPSGEAIFKDYWIPGIHVKGSVEDKTGLRPVPGLPILVGHDTGPVNYSAHLLQMVPTESGKVFALVFDELNFVRKRMPYERVVNTICERMKLWRDRMDYPFTYEHIADEAAFNQLNPNGKFDNAIIEELSKDPETGIPRIKMRPCPKGSDSVPARVRLIISMLQNDCLFVSAQCPHTIEMFEHLESEKVPEGKDDAHEGFRPHRSDYLHPFDSLSYPIFYVNFGGLVRSSNQITTQVYLAGKYNA